MDSVTRGFRSSRQIGQLGLLGGVPVYWRKGWFGSVLGGVVEVLMSLREGCFPVNGAGGRVEDGENRGLLVLEGRSWSRSWSWSWSWSSEVDRDLLCELGVVGINGLSTSLSIVKALSMSV